MRPEQKHTSDSDLESVFSNAETKPAKEAKPKKYVCSFGCGQKFKRLIQLDRHEFKHTGIKKHVCFHEGCSKTYSNTQSLIRHIKAFHEKIEQQKTVKCSFDFCNKMYTSIDNMERHIRVSHENPKSYHCPICDEKFSQRIKLKRHEVKHTGVYPYNCSKCSKGFVQEYNFTRHVCAKTYKCDQCEATFEKWTKLLAHRRELKHTEIHKCDQCSKEFKSNFFLAEHKNCHEDDKEVFKCTFEGCPRFYAYRRNLLHHIRTVHENKKIPCTFENCEVRLSDKRTLQNHIKVVHQKPQVRKPKLVRQKLSKRKDAGKRRQSTLSKLSGVFIEKEIDQKIMEGTASVEIDLEALGDEIVKGLEEVSSEISKEQDSSKSIAS